jgi:hypothetical protein
VDELLNVVEDAPTFFYGVYDGRKIVVSKHHVRRFFGNIGTGYTHRDADVGCFHGRGIIHAVTGHGDNLAAGFPRLHHTKLVLGRDAGINRNMVHLLRQLIVAYTVQFLTGDDAVIATRHV